MICLQRAVKQREDSTTPALGETDHSKSQTQTISGNWRRTARTPEGPVTTTGTYSGGHNYESTNTLSGDSGIRYTAWSIPGDPVSVIIDKLSQSYITNLYGEDSAGEEVLAGMSTTEHIVSNPFPWTAFDNAMKQKLSGLPYSPGWTKKPYLEIGKLRYDQEYRLGEFSSKGTKMEWFLRHELYNGELASPNAPPLPTLVHVVYKNKEDEIVHENVKKVEVPPGGKSDVFENTSYQDDHLPDGGSVSMALLPIEVVELSPKLRDADNNEIAGSEVPKNLPESNSMVEEAPNTNRIAHREMKVKVGSALKDKKITWTMDAKFTPEGQSQPSFRGDWARAATTHRDRFETSTAYGAHAYRRISQEQAETTVDADGFTAIRVNVPPIGFNKARIKIQIEGTTTPVELIDLDVQAVVVIDPGHGGTPDTDFQSASWNNSTSPSGVLEKTMALSYGQELKTSLEAHAQEQRLNLMVLMTRTEDVSVSGQARAHWARDYGADQLFIIHFNASQSHTARGTLEVRQDPNLAGSLPEDIEFIDAVLDRMVPAMQLFDAACNRRAHVVKDTTVATDTYMGNEANYHPVRAGYCEVEFIDFGAQTPNDRTDDAVDILLNTGPNAGLSKQPSPMPCVTAS